MEQIETLGTKVNHLAGIVPVAGPPLEFKMPWHDSLMPIAPDYLAVERAVYQCALAGCSTIWVVAHMGTHPLLRKRLGDSIRIPEIKNLSEKHENNSYEIDKVRSASIFYVPVHPKDRDKRDSLSWNALYGANSAYRLCKFISKWVIPDKFFCCFPYGITDDTVIKNNKQLLLSPQNVILSYNGETVKDGKYYHFTFKAEEYKKCRTFIRFWVLNSHEGNTKLRPKDYREAVNIPPAIAFSELDLTKYSVVECPWFYDISTWKSYSAFIGAGIELSIDRKLFRHNIREKLGGY
jgi:hypothetical protein